MPAASHFESSREEAWAVNVEGAKALIKACQDAGVRRFIYTSSTAVYFDGSDLVYVKESDPLPREEDMKSFYGASKAEGERIVLEANGKQGLYTCALRLSGIIG
jgi:sterol-4alpha-carboxylate 3-dehydrogenase (decarboxylating)